MSTITIQVKQEDTSFIKSLLEQLKGVEKISIDDDIVGYSAKGKPFSISEYKETIQTRIDDIKKGTAKTYTSAEVSKRILKR